MFLNSFSGSYIWFIYTNTGIFYPIIASNCRSSSSA